MGPTEALEIRSECRIHVPGGLNAHLEIFSSCGLLSPPQLVLKLDQLNC